jgi:hypothetical protein
MSLFLLAALGVLWSVRVDLSEIVPVVRHHFFLADPQTSAYKVKLVWLAFAAALAVLWEHSPMPLEAKTALVLALRLWAEFLIGCTHKTYVLGAAALICGALAVSFFNISHFSDTVPIAPLLGLAAQTARVLATDPKKHVVPKECAVQMLKVRTKTR